MKESFTYQISLATEAEAKRLATRIKGSRVTGPVFRLNAGNAWTVSAYGLSRKTVEKYLRA